MTAVAPAPAYQGQMGPGARSAALVLGFIVAFSFLGPILSYKPQPFTGEGNPLRQLCYLAALVGAVVAVGGIARPQRLLVIPWPIMVALLWCAVSLSWSVAPGTGMRRLILTITVIWSLFLAVREAGYERTVGAMRWVLVAALVINYACVLAVPGWAIHHFEELDDPGLIGDWRGFMGHKNFAGPACAFTILYFGLSKPPIRATFRWLILVAAAFFLFKTSSKTSMGLAVLGLVTGWLFHFYNPRFRSLILPALVILVTLPLLLWMDKIPELLAPLSRPDALTGRGQIWPVVLAFVSDHVMTGAGYGSFWNIGPDSPAFDYGHGWVVAMAQGHNGYLDVLATTGVPGLILVVIATLLTPLGKLLASQGLDKERGGLLLGSLVFCAGHNMTESTLFDRDLIVEVFLILTVALIYLSTRRTST